MDFCYALNALREGQKVERSGWNGKGMWIVLMPSEGWYVDEAFFGSEAIPTPGHERYPFIVMKTADGKIIPWLASQTDILADDWWIFGEKLQAVPDEEVIYATARPNPIE